MEKLEKSKIFLDYDGCIVNTIKCICSLYNEDFQYYKNFIHINWWEVNTWDFAECNCATPEYINTYFNQQRFFDRIEYMDWAEKILDILNKYFEITIVSSGYLPNLIAKEKWVKEHLPYCSFIGVNLKEYKDKSHIDMSDSIFIDDSANNLKTSNAAIKICFGDEYPWNNKWKGIRCNNWHEVENYIERVVDK